MRRLIVLVVTALFLFAACKPRVPKPGEKCRNEGTGSCSDATHLMKCVSGAWRLSSCLGPTGCAPTSKDSVRCDGSVSRVGEPCDAPNESACTSDGKQLLGCQAKKMALSADCLGPAACSFDATKNLFRCDQSIGALGALCSDEGKSACTRETKEILMCTGGKFVLDSACGGPKGCAIDGTMVRCDASRGEVGDACSGEGMACSKDGKLALECKSRRLAVARKCKKGCEQKGDDIYCN